MKTRQGIDRLSGEDKAKLLASVQRPSAPRPRPAPGAAGDTSFKTLPGYEEFRVMRAASDLLGVANPFYRQHDIRAGATSMIAGRPVVNFASYDYLGFNGHPAITQAVAAAAEQWGTSVSASRITAGERPFHRDLEGALAALHGAADAIVFVSGHATNVSVISQLVGPKDLVLHDALMHNSAVMGAQLSGAHRGIFPHNDMDALEKILSADRHRYGRALILTESLFSMDGDIPDLPALIELKKRFGCWLMVDEAHAIGVLGAHGRGAAEHFGIDPAVGRYLDGDAVEDAGERRRLRRRPAGADRFPQIHRAGICLQRRHPGAGGDGRAHRARSAQGQRRPGRAAASQRPAVSRRRARRRPRRRAPARALRSSPSSSAIRCAR